MERPLDFTSLRHHLKEKGVLLAQLDSNFTSNQYKAVNKKRRRKTTKKSAVREDLEEIGKRIALNIFDQDTDSATIALDDMDDIDGEGKESFWYHNISANPEEYADVCSLISSIAYLFYDDAFIALLNCFMRNKVHKEDELSDRVTLPQKQVESILSKLNGHWLIIKTICEVKKKSHNLWTMDLDKFVDAVNYRILKMRETVDEDIERISSEILQCPRCNIRFTSLQVPKLLDHRTGKYHCENCRTILFNIDNTGPVREKKLLKRELEDSLQPLMKLLERLQPSEEKQRAAREEEIKRNGKRPIPPHFGGSGRSRRRRTDRNNFTFTIEEEAAEEDEFNLDDFEDFNPTPIFFGSEDNRVYLSIIKNFELHNIEKATDLAKYLLDDVSEFEKIINATVYVYRITPHSLYLGYTRGYGPREIVRLLKLLSRNPMPLKLESLIRNETHGSSYYQATMVLRDGKCLVQSADEELLLNIIKNRELSNYLPTTNTMFRTERETGVVYAFEIHKVHSEDVKKVCKERYNVAIIDEFDFANNTSADYIKIHLKPTTNLRDYQKISVNKLFWNEFNIHSGMLVLPCGAGKTLIGINVVATLKKATIIFCHSILAVNQWREQCVKWTTMELEDVSRFSASHQKEWNPRANVLISTYGMFSSVNNRSDSAKNMMKKIKEREWGVMILDEVHLTPAKIFRTVTNQIKAHAKLGLTATMVREDTMIEELPNLVGPKLYEVDIFTLRMRGHIAPVQCFEIHSPLTDIFTRAYRNSETLEEKRLLYTTNPNKIRVAATLIKQHLSRDHKIMVFCDNLYGLELYKNILQKDKIDGKTPIDERTRILQTFRTSKGGDCVLFSTVGDQSIDLPEADVVIQVALLHGSRMQEGQRIGRVQRPQENKPSAYFYSLVSDETSEVKYAKKRRHFLKDLGYSVIRRKNDDWLEYITEDTEHVIGAAMQQKIIDSVHKELRSRRWKKNDSSKKIGTTKAPPKPKQSRLELMRKSKSIRRR
eukprot:TRINITY_DN8732_c0_g1_i1.p1 TRINITY_DN8732_c0_g1~~TRINITY_DN8732_c0_g1_i1.p1  ORF type:complete len:1155 (+),score=249.27 TRINITY_DN8732_c0_g1_i1:477-3467(+)